MAQLRKSAVQAKAREKARQNAADIARRHEQLLALAEEYHAAEIEADEHLNVAQRKADEIIVQGKAAARDAQQRSGATAQKMLDTGESARSVAERLGISNTALRKLTANAKASNTDDVWVDKRSEHAPAGEAKAAAA